MTNTWDQTQAVQTLQMVWESVSHAWLHVDNGKISQLNPAAHSLLGDQADLLVSCALEPYGIETLPNQWQKLNCIPNLPLELKYLAGDLWEIRIPSSNLGDLKNSSLIPNTSTNTSTNTNTNTNTLQNEFISTVSHELRTPLTSIRGALGLIAGGVMGELPPAVKSLLDIAYTNAERLARLINDILDMEKLETGQMVMEFQALYLHEVLQRAIAEHHLFAQQQGITLEFSSSSSPLEVMGDFERLLQVVSNLISNAIKFSPRGSSVTISAYAYNERVQVEILDQGIGIPVEFRQRIFSKFAQADASDVRERGGTGLGLALAKAISERHHGFIGYRDIETGGTCFFLELPHRAPTPRIQLKGKQARVLIVSQDADLGQLLSLMLGSSNHNPNLKSPNIKSTKLNFQDVVTNSLPEALEQLHASEPFHILLLEPHFGSEDLVGFFNQLEHLAPSHRPTLLLIGTSAQTRVPLRNLIEALVWIPKPIQRNFLVQQLEKALEERPLPKRILHLEADPQMRHYIKALLDDLAETVGVDSLEAALEQLAQEPFDLLLLDPQLERGNGLSLLQHLEPGLTLPVMVFANLALEPNQALQVQAELLKSQHSDLDLIQTIASLLEIPEHASKHEPEQ